MPRKPRRVDCVCKACGRPFSLPLSRVLWGRGVHCSKACFNSQMSAMRAGVPHRPGSHKSGPGSPNWRGRRAEKACPACGVFFSSVNSTCSAVCGQAIRSGKISGANNPFAKAHPKSERKCAGCGKIYSRDGTGLGSGKSFCSIHCCQKHRRLSVRQLRLLSQLTGSGIEVALERSWPWLYRSANKRKQRMRVDLYLPEFNVAVEYDGEHHHNPKRCQNGPDGFAKVQARDRAKDRLLSEHLIPLIRVKNWPVNLPNLLGLIRSLAC